MAIWYICLKFSDEKSVAARRCSSERDDEQKTVLSYNAEIKITDRQNVDKVTENVYLI
jgi:hypothetical protein